VADRRLVDTTSRASGSVWYFAYGSNLHPQRRASRAELSPVALMPGTLRGWRLVFDMPGVPPADPAMASIRRDDVGEVHGLLLRLRDHEFAALVDSEGGDRFYVREQVAVTTYDGQDVSAEVFVPAPGRRLLRERTPSRRYLDLIREGARLSSLCPDYCAWLEALPHADPSPVARWASEQFLGVFMRASQGPLRGLAYGYLGVLQRTEELAALPRRIAQSVLLAPVITVGLGLRLGANRRQG
jgi:hypothetical protein